MSAFPAFKGKEIVSILLKHGFVVSRKKGSHVFLKHPDGRATVVPLHAGETIGRGLFAKILRDVEIGIKDFLEKPGREKKRHS